MPSRLPVKFDNELVTINGRYYYRGTPLGTSKRREISLDLSIGTPQKIVLQKKQELLSELERSGGAAGASSFRLLQDDYRKDRKKEFTAGEFSPRSFYEMNHNLDAHLLPFFGSFKVEQIDQDSFEEFCETKRINVTNCLKTLNHFMKWCTRKKYLKSRPELFIPKFAKKKRREREVLSESEITRFLKAADGPLLLYISMYLFMGMRNMEITRLLWSDVDFNDQSILIRPENNRKRKLRVIPINKNVLKLLNRAHGARGGDERALWVFPAFRRGTKANHAAMGWHRKAWDKAVNEAQIEKHITPHDLRATFETFMHTNSEFTDSQREKMAGAKIDVQKDVYVKLSVDQIRGLENSVKVEGVDKIFGEKLGEKLTKKKAAKRASNRKKTKN